MQKWIGNMWRIVAKHKAETKAVIKHHGSMAALKEHWAKLGRKDSSIGSLHQEEAGPEGLSWSGSNWLKKKSFNLAWKKRLRMGKAAEVDNIDGEMMKYGGKHVQNTTWTLIKAIENQGVGTRDGDPQNPAYCRGITLLCKAAKVFEGAILVQLNIQAREHGKAYDMLDHNILARTLHKREAEEAAVGIIAELYCGMTNDLAVVTSDPFKLQRRLNVALTANITIRTKAKNQDRKEKDKMKEDIL
ncbi:hypothetical protein QOT17_017117 [Balamuthia mandrillaris]